MPVSYVETELYARTMKENGIKPELEVYNQRQFWLVNNLIGKGLLSPPYMIQFAIEFQSGAYSLKRKPLTMIQALRNSMPR
ncbi:MAG: 3-keto-5-aminohexanoate cleavage protein [Candidatus Paceibacterota bacterium]|jgi:uncharacterized protein (DUF849 family)